MSQGWSGRIRLGAALLLGAALVAACSEALLDPAGSDTITTMAVVLEAAPAVAGTNGDAFTRADAAHIRVAASATSPAVLDTVLASSGAAERNFALPVHLSAASGTYLLTVTLTSRGSALFQGSTPVRLRRGYHENVQLTLAPIVAGIALADTLPSMTAIGDTVRVRAAAIFASGDTVTGVLPTWSDDGTGVVRAASDGLVTSLREGDARLTASYQGASATTRIRVQAVVTRIDMSPDSVIVYPDTVRALLATARDRNGNKLTRSFAWRSTDSTIATVDTAGRVRGVAPGRTFVSATIGAQSGRALVIVRPTPVASVGMKPDSAILLVGDTLRVKATPLDASGKPLTGRLVTWSASLPAVATVDTTGLVTALVDGRDTIFATSEGKVGITIIKVYPSGLGPVSTQITFNGVVGQPNPPAQQVAVNASAGGPITGLAATITYAAGQPTGWLSAALSGATAPAALTLTPDITGLAVGSYAATVKLSTSTSSRLTGAVNVTLNVTSSPAPPPPPPPPPPPTVASVRIVPHSATIPVGGNQQLGGTAYSASGTPLTATIAWTSLDPAIVSVTQAGLVTGLALGSGRVVASANGHADTATVTVVANTPVTTLRITPHSDTIPVGAQQPFSATPLDALGNPLPYTVSWTSLDPAVVSVTQLGVVTGVGPGTGRVVASAGGRADTATVLVTAVVVRVRITPHTVTVPVDVPQPLSAAVLDGTGAALPYTPTWTSLDPGIVSVSQSGVALGLATGTGRVVAAAGGKADTATLTITNTPVSLRILARNDTIPVGGQTQLSASVLDAGGAVLPYAPGWTSLDPGIVSVTSAGMVTGIAVGTGRVVASAFGLADTATVLVTPPVAVAAVRITPDTATIATGGQKQLTGTALDAANNPLPLPLTWVSRDPGIVSVSQTGLVTGVAAGTGRVTATAGGKADTATITVLAPVVKVQITPATATIPVGGQQQLGATPLDAANNPVPLPVTWTSLDPAIVSVSATGLVTGIAAGTGHVTAAAGGRVDTATITVTTVGPTSWSLVRAGALSLGACGLNTAGAGYCWGRIPFTSQPGGGLIPTPVPGSATFTDIVGGFRHGCGVTTAGAALCWGDNTWGELGDGAAETASVNPVAVSGGLTFRTVSVGMRHTCGLTPAGAAYCWGSDDFGELGAGLMTNSSVPVAVAGGLTFSAISAGNNHTCAVTAAGQAYCWGRGSSGELGVSVNLSTTPVAVSGGLTFATISAGNRASCGTTTSGAVYCWGNAAASLGTSSATPVLASPTALQQVAADSVNACGVDAAGAAQCAGANDLGQLGDGTNTPRTTLAPVAGGYTFTAVTVGQTFACGLTTGQRIVCWGSNAQGQLGNGSGSGSLVPVPVTDP